MVIFNSSKDFQKRFLVRADVRSEVKKLSISIKFAIFWHTLRGFPVGPESAFRPIVLPSKSSTRCPGGSSFRWVNKWINGFLGLQSPLPQPQLLWHTTVRSSRTIEEGRVARRNMKYQSYLGCFGFARSVIAKCESRRKILEGRSFWMWWRWKKNSKFSNFVSNNEAS